VSVVNAVLLLLNFLVYYLILCHFILYSW